MSSALAKRIKHGRFVTDNDQRPEEELVMVGYACTIFRDDEKADFINEERHLMEHPSDVSVTMDRYDARLHLQELDLFDAAKTSRGNGNGVTETKYVDADESELEFERYRDLMAADDNDEANCGTNVSPAVEHQSDSSTNDSRNSSPFVDENTKESRSRRKEQPFVPPPELELPTGMQAPQTMQMHAIIAKTAAFVATKGPQMEIVIKAKQKTKENHFEFLEFDHPIRPYYDHVLGMIKRGRYQYVEPEQESDEDDDDGGDYLHPSLMISASSSSLAGMVKEKEKQEEEVIEKPKEEEQPSVDLQPIMDRLAEYVARNGDAFEDVVRGRKDPLYAFIEPKHEFHNYYRQRVLHYRSQQNKAEQKVQSISQRSIRSSTSSPSAEKYGRSERRSRKYSPRPSSRSSRRRHRSRSRSYDEDNDRERRHERRHKERKREERRRRRSPTPSDDEETSKNRSSNIKFATFVPVPPSEEISDSPGLESSPVQDILVKKSLGVDEEEKTDDTVKKMQEERRAKAKVFLMLMKDRDQKASKIVNAGKKPWEEDD